MVVCEGVDVHAVAGVGSRNRRRGHSPRVGVDPRATVLVRVGEHLKLEVIWDLECSLVVAHHALVICAWWCSSMHPYWIKSELVG